MKNNWGKIGAFVFVGLIFILALTIFVSAYEVIIDNNDSKFSTTGSWTNANNACGYNGDYVYETDTLTSSTARWNLTISTKGNYSVYAHYCVHSARPTAVQFTIRHAKGLSFTAVDETKDAFGNSSGDFTPSGWKLLGNYEFNLTSITPNQFVRLNTTSAGDTCADAIKLVLLTETPNVDFVSPTQSSGVINYNKFTVNVSSNSIYLSNLTLNLYNSAGSLMNTTFSVLQNIFVEYFLADGTYSFNASASDITNKINYSETRTVTIDTQNPNIKITNPTNNSKKTTNTFDIFYTISDLTLQSCWWTRDDGLTNTTIICGINITTAVWDQGNTLVAIYVNDSFNNLNSSSVSFLVDSIKPQVTIVSPANNSKFNINSLDVNYIASDTNLQNCSWTRNNGQTNTSIICGENITGQTWNEGWNNIKLFVQDSFGNKNSSTVNFLVDTIPPYVAFNSPASIGYNTNNILIDISNSSDVQSVWWSENGSSFVYTLPTINWFSDGVHTIFAYANDSLGNLNETNITFSIDTIPPAIINTSANPCYYSNKDIILNINVDELNLESVLLEANFEGTWKNYSANCTNVNGTLYSCSYIVDSNFLNSSAINGAFYWKFFTNDSYGHSSETNEFLFGTLLEINPSTPDGLNGWYVTEPNFSLISNYSESFYKWERGHQESYNGTFGLENDGLFPTERAGILTLGYWSNTYCGMETQKNKTLKIDLTKPRLERTSPTNNSLVSCNYKPAISSIVSDIYSGNSNVNSSSLIMKIDGTDVTAEMNKSGWGDYKLKTDYFPTNNLTVGNHLVTISGQDNAGNLFSQDWNFDIAAITGFTSSVISPIDGASYGSNKVLVNVSSDSVLKEMKFMDYGYPPYLPRLLCRNCSSYDNKVYFADGWHHVEFNFTDACVINQKSNISFLVDTISPRITSTSPTRNTFTNGSKFSIRYTEINLVNITLVINGTEIDTGCNVSGTLKTCEITLDLSAFNGQSIEYYFRISDPVRTINSTKIKIYVDTSKPVLNVYSPIQNKVYVKAYNQRIPFNITLRDDASTTSLKYYDSSAFFPRWITLCTKCTQYGNLRYQTVALSGAGKWHNVTFVATDQAGNTKSIQKKFFVE